MLMHCYNL